MNRRSIAPSFNGQKDNVRYRWDNPMARPATEYISLERCLDLYPNIPFSTKISILLDVSSELTHLHAQNPPVIVGNVSKCVALTSGLKATLVEDVSGEENRILDSDSRAISEATPSHDIYQFGLLVLQISGKDPVDAADKPLVQHEKAALETMSDRQRLSKLAMSCLQPDRAMRPSADRLCSSLRQLSASCAKELSEAPERKQEDSAIFLDKNEKFTEALEAENRQLRARCKELEVENERLKKAYSELEVLSATREENSKGTEGKERGASWLSSFIKRSRKSEPNLSLTKKHEASLISVEEITFAKGEMERRPSRPTTRLFAVGEFSDIHGHQITEQSNCLSQRPLPALPSCSRDHSTTALSGEEDDKAQSYEIPAAALRLETQQWFQAGVTVEEAQLRLKEIKIDGAYLVRESSTVKGQYTLSIYQGGHIRHIRIQNINKNQYTVDHQIIFENISEVIKYYKSNPIRLKDGFESLLLHECSNRKCSH